MFCNMQTGGISESSHIKSESNSWQLPVVKSSPLTVIIVLAIVNKYIIRSYSRSSRVLYITPFMTAQVSQSNDS